MTPQSDSRVTLEQLLRLKRTERPSAEFWTQFEQELRAKQLAAIVEKRPWWSGFGRVGSVLRRSGMPLGAVAAVSVALLGLREAYFSSLPTPVSNLASAAGAVRTFPASAVAPTSAPVFAAVAPSPAASMPHSEPRPSPGTSIADAALVPQAALRGGDDLPVGAWGRTFVQSEANFASASAISVNSGEHDLLGGMSADHGAGFSPAHARSVEPLAKMTSPSEERRERLLAETVSSGVSDFAPHSNDRMIDSLSEDRLNEAIQRYGVEANSVSFKF